MRSVVGSFAILLRIIRFTKTTQTEPFSLFLILMRHIMIGTSLGKMYKLIHVNVW